MWRKVHGILCREKFISCGKTYLWSMVVSPWNLNLWFLDHGISTDVLIPSIELMVLVCYGFGPWYCFILLLLLSPMIHDLRKSLPI